MTGKKSKRAYFINEIEAAAFNTAFTLMLAKRQKEAISYYISPGNTHRFRHGGDWNHPGAPEAINGGMQTHSAIIETQFQDLVDNDLGAIDRSAQLFIEAMHQQFTQMLYLTVSAACDRSGNTVDAKKEGSLENAFMAMIEKIQFSVDKNGKVQLPKFLPPHTDARMMAALEGASQEYKERLEVIVARKIEAALGREVERKAKFACYGDDA